MLLPEVRLGLAQRDGPGNMYVPRRNNADSGGTRARGSSHMGRGRAKAKQTKVARELKYSSPQTDFDALRAELTGTPPDRGRTRAPAPEEDDPLAKYIDEDEEGSR